ncbi:Listeria/Bacterioides repeat [Candidatus Nanopelagicaceae bacterium]
MEGYSKLRYGSAMKLSAGLALGKGLLKARTRIARSLVTVLVGTLLIPLGSIGIPSALDRAQAAVGTVTCSGGGSFSVNAVITANQGANCVGIATIPLGVTEIGGNAFQQTNPSSGNLGRVTSIVWPASGLTTIGASAFAFTGLTSINIPSSVTSIASQAFSDNASLTSASIAGGTVGSPLNSGYYIFNNTPNLTSLTLGSGVMNLGWLQFAGSSITTITGGSGVRAIGDQTLSGVNLQNFSFGNSVTTIGIESFRNTKFTSIALPCGLSSIGTSAFTIGANVTSVQMCADTGTVNSSFSMGASAFSQSPNLKIFSFGKSLATTVNVTTWNDSVDRIWTGDTSLKWIQYCGSGSSFAAMTAHLVQPYIPSGVTVSCTPPKSVMGSLVVTSNGNNYSASGVTNNLLSLTLPSGKEVSDNSAYTVEAWVKIDAASNTGSNNVYGSIAFADTEYGTTDAWNQRTIAPGIYGSYYLNVAGSLQARCDQNPGDTSEQNGLCPNVTIPRGQWTHIAMQKSAPTGFNSRLIVYINGRIAVSRSVTNNSAVLKYIKIGGFGDNNSAKVSYGQIRVSSGAIYPTDGSTTFTPPTQFSTSVSSGSVISLFQPLFNSAVTSLSDGTGNGTLIKTYVGAGNVTVSSDVPIDPPSAASLSISQGHLSGGTSTVLSGTNLTGATSVTVGGVTATLGTVTDTSVAFTTPVSATIGDKDVVVTVGSSTATLVGGFTYRPIPTATSLSLALGSLSGGASSVLVGTGLTSTSGLTINGVTATLSTITDTSVAFTTPASVSLGAKDVVVTTAGGTATLTGGFTYVSAPTITSLSATSGSLTGGYLDTITGTNFTGATSVKVDSVTAAFSVSSSTSIVFALPSSSTAGPKDVVVVAPGGTVTRTGGFTYNGAARVPSFDSATPTANGFTLQITNWDPAFTWSGISSLSGSVTISSSGLITVTGISPGTFSTVTIQTSRTGFDSGSATSSSIKSVNGTSLTPIFDTATSTSNGFTLQIKNYDSAFTWSGTNSLGKTTSISNTGLITVTGVNPGVFSTVTIQTTRTGFDTGTAVSSSIKSINGSALNPTFSTETGTATGFLLQISNFDAAYTWTGSISQGGSVSINNSTGLLTVSDISPGTFSTVTIQTTRTGFDTGTATSLSYKSINGTALTPTFSTETGTATGFQLQISNYDTRTTWSGTNSAGGTVSISGTGLVTVTGLNPGTSSTVTITTTRTGYDTGTATSSSYSSNTGSAKTPGFGAAISTADGFTLPITNFDANYTWSATNSLGKSVSISGTGLITLTGVSPGTSSTVTVRSTRIGYETGTATSPSISSLTGAAKVPTFGSPTSTLDGFTLPITNYETATTWSVTNSLGKSASINSTTGLITVTGVATGTFSTVTVRTTRTGYETGTATSSSISSATAATQPTDVSATTAARSAVVSWTAPSDTGGIAITDYAVEYSSTNGETWTAFTHSPSSLTNLTVTGLLDGTSYLYRVAAINAVGQSPFSTSSAVVTSYYVVCTTGSFWVAGSTIPSAAGANCTGTVTIPVGITGVAINSFAPGSAATQTNRALTSIAFPASGFVNIDQGGFRNLGLTSLTIPASVTMVGLSAFENNPLTSVTITGASGGASTYLSQGAFNNQNPAFGLSTSIALTLGSGKIDIGFNFGYSTRFSTVDFGSGINSIDETAFKQNGISPGWVPLFPSTITSIGKDAFTYNPSLSTIRFGSNITSSITAIDNAAFDSAYVKSVQYCGPTGTVLSNYLKNRLPLAKVWCNFVVPNAPTISSTSQTNQQVTIAWTKGTSLDEAPTDTFTIQYKSGGGSWISVAYDSSTPLSSTIRNLTNGTTYSFRVAANNIAGSSSYSSEVQVTPLGLATIPTFDTSVATANGFTFNVTNYDSRTAWAATVTAGSASVSIGTANGSSLPITVTSMNNGATVSIQVTTTRSNFETGTASTAGTSLNGALTPTFGTASVTTNGFTAAITNYDSNYTWSVSTSSGSVVIVNGSIVVSGAAFATTVIETVTATRANYVTGRANLSVTTLAALTATYYGNGNTGGLAPSDTSTYQTNGTLVVLGNIGALTKPGYTFTGWNLNSGNTGPTYTAGNIYTLANAGVSFYAQWTATPFNVIYHATEATSGAVPTDPTTYTIGMAANVRGNSGNLIRTGYVFAGWADNANRTGRIYISGDTYTVQTNNVDLWAAWTPNTYTVIFDTNGASGAPSKLSDSYTVGSSLVRLATIGTMSKSGYNFAGWATQSVGTPMSDSFTVASNTTLFAQWSIASFTLSYNLDGGTGSVPAPAAVNYLEQFNLAPSTGLTKVDTNTVTYAFVSWSLNSQTYNPGQSYFMPASNLTFTATWTRIYNVTYSFSGGSVATPIADEQKVSGDTITVSTVTPTRTGYDFVGWVDQSGRTSAAGDEYVVSDGHYLLYAQWSATPFSVTYDAAGGSPSPTESSKTIGQSFSVGAAPSKTGYDFKGWNDGANTFAAGAPYVTQSNNIVFTAQWQAQVYRVKYDLNGGSGSAGGDRIYTYGTSAYTLPTTGFSLTDYSFAGWTTAPGGPTVGTTFAPSSDISLYAIWNIAIYRLTFDGQSGLSDSSTAKVTMGQSLVLPSATRANYVLQGWSNQQSGGNLTASGSSYTPTADATLYAQWALQVFTVTYNGNGGTSDVPTASMTYGSTTPLVLPVAIRNHYFFDGWYSAASGGYLIGAPGAGFSPTSSVTIYAHWTQASLQGLGQATKIAEVTVLSGNNSSFTAGSQGSSATVSYTADSLPSGTVITAYVQSSTERASTLIDPNSSYILSMVVAWVAPDGTVPDTAPGEPIVITISNSGITKGSRVYGLVGTTPKFLGVAAQDGSVQVELTQDPTVTVAITKPDSVTAVTAVSLDDVSALVTWDAPEVTGGSPITNYTVTSSAGQTCSTATTSCTVTGLTALTDYTFRVVARNSIGSSDQSLPSGLITTSGAPAPPAPPAPPSNSSSSGSVVAPIASVVQAPTKEDAATPEVKPVPAPEVKPIPTEDPNQGGKSDADKAAENAQKLALEDAAKAAAEIVPAITVYSISKDFKLSDYNLAYLHTYLSTLKPHAMVTCIGYTYTLSMSLLEATALAKKQANALCEIIKKDRPTLSTSILIRPSESAPKAALGAQWVAVSYRVDGYEPITPTKRFQDIQTGLSFLAYQPSYTAALEIKKIEIIQCASNKNYGLNAQFGTSKKSIVITEYGVTKSCSFATSLTKGAKQTIVIKKGTSMRPGARISLVTIGLTSIDIKKIIAGLVRVPIQ